MLRQCVQFLRQGLQRPTRRGAVFVFRSPTELTPPTHGVLEADEGLDVGTLSFNAHGLVEAFNLEQRHVERFKNHLAATQKPWPVGGHCCNDKEAILSHGFVTKSLDKGQPRAWRLSSAMPSQHGLLTRHDSLLIPCPLCTFTHFLSEFLDILGSSNLAMASNLKEMALSALCVYFLFSF